MTQTLLSLFPKPEDLLALAPEDLAGVVVELMPPLMQNHLFNPAALSAQLFTVTGASYPQGARRAVNLAIAEALSWLLTQGILIVDPEQPSGQFYVLSRRAVTLRARTDVEAFRKGRILPDDLLPALFLEKVVPLFRRGDHDIAVFQAFKEVEVAVRRLPIVTALAIPILRSGRRSCARRSIQTPDRSLTNHSFPPNGRRRCIFLQHPSVTQRIQLAIVTSQLRRRRRRD